MGGNNDDACRILAWVLREDYMMKLLCKKCLLQINPLICPSEIHVMHYVCVVIKTSLFLYSKYLKQESEDKRGKDLDISDWTLRSKRRVVSFLLLSSFKASCFGRKAPTSFFLVILRRFLSKWMEVTAACSRASMPSTSPKTGQSHSHRWAGTAHFHRAVDDEFGSKTQFNFSNIMFLLWHSN